MTLTRSFASVLCPVVVVVVVVVAHAGCKPAVPPRVEPAPAAAPAASSLAERARALAQRALIVDGHVDLPWRLWSGRDASGAVTEDIAQRTPKGDFDLVRAKEGGLDAPFMSIYVPAGFENNGAKKMADELIDLVESLVARAPAELAIARSPAEIVKLAGEGKLALPLGLENGSPIEGKLENLAHFHARGIRYITLAHSEDNHLADSSYSEKQTNKGLSPFGREVVAEMNRLGIFVDVSHLSDDAARQAIELSRAPVIASHSSCRHFTPGWQRNISDELIRLLAHKGGVVMINFGSSFVDDGARKSWDALREQLDAQLAAEKLEKGSDAAKAFTEEFYRVHKGKYADVGRVADHVDHVVELVGVEHVGLGSDYDGVGDSLPEGLKDVSQYPRLFAVLLERGYSEADVEKLAGSNVLKAWTEMEGVARSLASR